MIEKRLNICVVVSFLTINPSNMLSVYKFDMDIKCYIYYASCQPATLIYLTAKVVSTVHANLKKFVSFL